MKSHELLEVIGEAQDSYLLDAKAPQKNSAPVWVKWAAMAACLILIVGLLIPKTDAPNPDNDTIADVDVPVPSEPFLPGGAVSPDNMPGGAVSPDNMPGGTASTGDDSLHYGQVNFLSVFNKADTGISGQVFQHIAGTENPSSGSQGAPPNFEFARGYIHIVAKAVEELGIYEKLNEYGSTRTYQYRLFSMQVIDPLQSGIEGGFYYLLPSYLKGDLTQYSELLISMTQLPKNFVLRNGDKLTAFEYLFCDPYNTPELGNIIAFTNGVFDESLWQDRSWLYGYQFGRFYLDENRDSLLVSRGSTLEEALQRRQSQLGGRIPAQVNTFDFKTEAAQQLMNYLKPFENGIFVPEKRFPFRDYLIRRYINGCPTNEWYHFTGEGEKILSSKFRFENVDFEKLPNIAAYIASLDLSRIAPQHTDAAGKALIYNTAVGWYEKTETGVYSIVRIAWRYFDQEDSYIEYYDETFILLDETGDHIISREELIALIGENQNISSEEYGAGIDMPMY